MWCHTTAGRRPSAKADNGARSVHNTQREAIHKARDLAIRDKVEVVIHRRDGKIRDSDSYGPDPVPPRDKKH